MHPCMEMETWSNYTSQTEINNRRVIDDTAADYESAVQRLRFKTWSNCQQRLRDHLVHTRQELLQHEEEPIDAIMCYDSCSLHNNS